MFSGILAIGIEVMCGHNARATVYLTSGGTKSLEAR